jgi:DNA-binding CsgD family transcriptional regulator
VAQRAQAIIDASVRPFASDLQIVAVQASIMRHDIAGARACLDRSASDAREPRARLERDLGLSMIDLEAGDRRAALVRGAAVVGRARDEGHVRLFLDAGRPTERLLRALHVAPGPYVQFLVRTAESTLHEAGSGVAGLSERELEVVRYLPTSLSSGEIAARLYISLNTLKTHLRTIYRKLGVHGRREAVERARDLCIA